MKCSMFWFLFLRWKPYIPIHILILNKKSKNKNLKFDLKQAFAARTTSKRYENSSQTRWSISGSIKLIVVVIWCFKLTRSVGYGRTKTLSFTNPQRKKSQTERSGDLGGQAQRAMSWAPIRPVAEAVFHLKML